MRKVGSMGYRGMKRVQTVNKEPSETIQSDAHLADIHKILGAYTEVDMRDMLDQTQLVFADITQFTDLGDALNQAKRAEVQFMTLPSKVREVFHHDVAEWLDTAHDEDKRALLVEAGFLSAPEDAADVVEPLAATGVDGADVVDPTPE